MIYFFFPELSHLCHLHHGKELSAQTVQEPRPRWALLEVTCLNC